jgi:translation initiation factor IF-3
MKREEALLLVRPEAGLDLIEVAPQAKPPVARLMSFDKYRYQKEKEEKKERLAQKTSGFKQVQISARAAQNDLLVKAKQLDKFLGDGSQVGIQVRLRGREKANKGWARQKLAEFLKMIVTEYKIVNDVKFGGRGMGIVITRK